MELQIPLVRVCSKTNFSSSLLPWDLVPIVLLAGNEPAGSHGWNPDVPQCCARSTQCRYCKAVWEARCLPWGCWHFNLHFVMAKIPEKTNKQTNTTVITTNPGKTQSLSIHRFLFDIPRIWVSWHLSQVTRGELQSRCWAGNPGFWHSAWLPQPWAFLKGLISECTDVPVEVFALHFSFRLCSPRKLKHDGELRDSLQPYVCSS